MPQTDIEQVNRWIYAKCSGDPLLSDAVGVHPTLNIKQIYSMKSIQGAARNLRVNLASALIGDTTITSTLQDGKFAKIPPATYYTDKGKAIVVTSQSNFAAGNGTLIVSPLSSNIIAGEFLKIIVPQIIYRPVGGNVKRGTGGRKIASKLTYIIKAVCIGDSMNPIIGLAAEIEKQFQQSQLVDDVTVIGCSIIQPVIYDEDLEDGTTAFHFGHMLEIFAYNQITP